MGFRPENQVEPINEATAGIGGEGDDLGWDPSERNMGEDPLAGIEADEGDD